MNYYYVIKDDNTVYTIKSKNHVIKEHLKDRHAKHIIPVNIFEYLWIKLMYTGRTMKKKG